MVLRGPEPDEVAVPIVLFFVDDLDGSLRALIFVDWINLRGLLPRLFWQTISKIFSLNTNPFRIVY